VRRSYGEMQWNKPLEEEAKYMAKVSIPLAMNFSENMNSCTRKMYLQFSLIGHNQNSVYGNSTFLANQKNCFLQLLWDKN
jgi:outer membrane receptor for ferrienterochelin and colicins